MITDKLAVYKYNRRKLMTEVQEVVLSVPDVSCQHCVKTIDKALGVLPGVETVLTDLSTKTVHVQYDPSQVTLNQVEATLDDAGYTVAH
jgi:copper chaperone